MEADADVPVSLVQKDDASNIQNETGEDTAGEIEGMTGAAPRGLEAHAGVPVSLVQKEDASNIQNETGEDTAGKSRG